MGFEGAQELNWKNCEGKWKSLTAAYRKTIDHNNRTGNERRECAFFSELSEVYGYRPTVNPVATASSSGKGDSLSGNSEDETREIVSPIPGPSASGTKRKLAGQDDSTKVKSRRRKSSDEMVSWLDEYKKEKAAQEEERLKQMKELHREQMELLGGFLQVLKDITNK